MSLWLCLHLVQLKHGYVQWCRVFPAVFTDIAYCELKWFIFRCSFTVTMLSGRSYIVMCLMPYLNTYNNIEAIPMLIITIIIKISSKLHTLFSLKNIIEIYRLE